MYRNFCPQKGRFTLFFSVGSKPLCIWDTHLEEGNVSRFIDPDLKSAVMELRGRNVSTSYIICPKDNQSLGIPFPFLVIILKNIKHFFTFVVTVLDETNMRRRFRISNFQSTTKISPFETVMPLSLADGWNQVQCNLSELTRRAYDKLYIEAVRLKINANVRLRRVYFTSRLDPEDELPPDYKIFFPIGKGSKGCQICHKKESSFDEAAQNNNLTTASDKTQGVLESNKWQTIISDAERSNKSNENKSKSSIQTYHSVVKSGRPVVQPNKTGSTKSIQINDSVHQQSKVQRYSDTFIKDDMFSKKSQELEKKPTEIENLPKEDRVDYKDTLREINGNVPKAFKPITNSSRSCKICNCKKTLPRKVSTNTKHLRKLTPVPSQTKERGINFTAPNKIFTAERFITTAQ